MEARIRRSEPSLDTGLMPMEEVWRAVLAVDRVRLLPRVDFRPRDLLLASIGLLDGGVQHPDRGRPDVRARAVALDEGDDGTVRHLQLAVADRDLLACRDLDVGRHGIALLALAVISRRSGRSPP